MHRLFLPMLLIAGCAHQPSVPLDQSTLMVWFQQRGVETRNLQINSQQFGNGTGGNLPIRVQFKTPKPSGELEKWRLQLREDLTAWLVEKGHPEGQCTSVTLKSEQDQVAVDIQIVCR